MAERAVHYLTIGHVAKDLTSGRLSPDDHTLGGTVSFSSLTAHHLDYTPGIVTAHAGDVDLSPLDGLPIAALASPDTTTFENIYAGGKRTQWLRAQDTMVQARTLRDGNYDFFTNTVRWHGIGGTGEGARPDPLRAILERKVRLRGDLERLVKHAGRHRGAGLEAIRTVPTQFHGE